MRPKLNPNPVDFKIHTYIERKKQFLKWNEKHRKYPEYIGVKFLLSKNQVKSLLEERGITIYDIGRKSDEFNLARYNDKGNYQWGNCKFITSDENRREKKGHSQRGREILFRGVLYKSISDCMRRTRLTDYKIRKELGLIEEKKYQRKTKEVLFRGKNYSSISEIMKEYNLSRYLIEKELNPRPPKKMGRPRKE